MRFCLGRRPVKRDPRIRALAQYKRGLSLPPPPAVVDYYSKVSAWPMYLNNQLGDCVVAALGHAIQQWRTYTSASPVLLTDAQIEALYEQDGGYVPGNASTDQGCVETDVLTNWMNGAQGDTLAAYAMVNVADLDEVKDSIQWTGNCYLGINCPQSAQDNTSVWDVVPNSPIEGGHAVLLVGYDETYFYTVSWGMLIPTTPAFLATYMEEAYMLVDADWIEANGTAPSGVDLKQLILDSQSLTQ